MDSKNEVQPLRVPDDAKLNQLVSAMAHSQKKAAEEKASPKKRRRKTHPLVLVGLLPVLAGVVYFNVTFSPAGIPVSAETSVRESIYVTVLALNAEFEETGEYPADLETVGMDEEGLSYSLTTDGYSLTAEEEGIRVRYQSGEDLEPFRAAFETLLPPFEEGQ